MSVTPIVDVPDPERRAIERVVLAYFWPGEEMTISTLLERTRPAVIAGWPAITHAELKRALIALERRPTSRPRRRP